MRKIAIVLASAFSVGGCEPADLLLPMEPTAESVAAPRRALTEEEKETISDAVSLAIKDPRPPEFVWAPLVVRINDGVADYCGIVKSNVDNDGRHSGYHKYFAQISFDRRGKISKVEVRQIVTSTDENMPNAVDSICMRDGYSVLPAVR